MEDFVLVVKNRVGKEQGKSAENILEGVLKNRT
jgi:hypothetical protein